MASWLVKRRQRSMAHACTESRGAPGMAPWSRENRTLTIILRKNIKFRLANEIKLEITETLAWFGIC